MLKVLSANDTYSEPCALLLGGFDGFHAGHKSLFACAEKSGLPVGITTITGGKNGGDLFTFSERTEIFAREGFAFVVGFEFSEQFRNTAAETFLRDIFERVNVKKIVCGEDFRFGKDAAGSPDLLEKIAPCSVEVLPLKVSGGEKIAVSGIKRRLAEGDIAGANGYLSSGFFVQGIVEHGREVGRTYGFPTLNLTYPNGKFLLKEGVYGGRAETPRGTFPAVINFGARPTFGVQEKKAEAYLLGFDGNLYGETVRFFPTVFLRPVMKFPSRDALMRQLEKDIERFKRGEK